ncbi:hypothetical protein LXL04_013737 [Taraxacum kok-saghyz]
MLLSFHILFGFPDNAKSLIDRILDPNPETISPFFPLKAFVATLHCHRTFTQPSPPLPFTILAEIGGFD